MHVNGIQPAEAAHGADPMKFYRDIGGWTLVFAILIAIVVGDAFGIWMGWLSTH